MADNSATARSAPAAAGTWYVYLLECRGARLYCGITPDLAARFARHRSGKGAAYTRMHAPLRMLAAMPCDSRASASRVEAATKKLSAAAKRALAAHWPLRVGLPGGGTEPQTAMTADAELPD